MSNPTLFIREVREELKKVSYPTRAEVIRLTILVIAVCLLISLYLSGLDLLFGKMVEFLLTKKIF